MYPSNNHLYILAIYILFYYELGQDWFLNFQEPTRNLQEVRAPSRQVTLQRKTRALHQPFQIIRKYHLYHLEIRLSFEARDSSKLISLKCLDLSDNLRPSTPLSKSTTSLQFLPQMLQSSRQGMSTMKRIKTKLMMYTQDLKLEMDTLRKHLQASGR